ncbi:hypothetical protein GQ55_2G040300 [Panicum hallii var. hallii]|uniref:Bifunctional inhibitor/plant lipid transfer protein/seed storage helical domain-containing protein n=1 Tax=Panicum hallii var. hallii TaxID=1504633 RepID=A0A2T7EL73_9POAL|nr:hypothetical protein GQ55_2G040300 [Panicum hallii var. hallii]
MGLNLNLAMRLLAAAAVVASLAAPASGQGGAASCTASLITSFTPCLNFLTNSTNGGGSAPTQDCCRSLAALVNASTGCACLILTGNVPLGAPINRTLAVTLPKACDSAAVPLQCRDTSAQIPAPGPVAAGAPSAALPPLPPATPATPEPEAPAPPVVDPTGTAPVSQGQTRPMVLPSSAWRASDHAPATAALVLLLAAGAALV